MAPSFRFIHVIVNSSGLWMTITFIAST
uniref:Uncharacterized protein n=1 Tax=Arundo donax TaxID=35708 RepID=A0A0A9AJ11_ARUDO